MWPVEGPQTRLARKHLHLKISQNLRTNPFASNRMLIMSTKFNFIAKGFVCKWFCEIVTFSSQESEISSCFFREFQCQILISWKKLIQRCIFSSVLFCEKWACCNLVRLFVCFLIPPLSPTPHFSQPPPPLSTPGGNFSVADRAVEVKGDCVWKAQLNL